MLRRGPQRFKRWSAPGVKGQSTAEWDGNVRRMQTDKLTALWGEYRSRGIDPTVHPDDHMFRSNPALDQYDTVGESAIRAIFSVLAAAPKDAVWRVLDFGCGHGRVARHLRAFFPAAEMWFADSDPSCIDFCAQTFNGTPIRSPADFTDLELPSGLDLIWVGSVFTHIDLERMKILHGKLFDALGPGGLLVATFHGRRWHEITRHQEQWAPMTRDYETTGMAYQSYGREDLGDWGVSLSSVETVIGLGRREDAQLIGYTETGWANLQDVAAWMRRM
jgi:SAM-dependent methyltransferase